MSHESKRFCTEVKVRYGTVTVHDLVRTDDHVIHTVAVEIACRLPQMTKSITSGLAIDNYVGVIGIERSGDAAEEDEGSTGISVCVDATWSPCACLFDPSKEVR